MTLTTVTERSSDPWDEDWRELAACRDAMTSNAWTTDEANAAIDEMGPAEARAQEAECIAICRGCPVRQQCAITALSEDSFIAQSGTIAGTTAPQRVWLRANSGIATQVAIDCAKAGVSTDDLSDWYTAAGPDTLPEEDDTPTEIRRNWGVHESTYRQWRSARGMAGGATDGRNEKEHVDAYGLVFSVLADGEWHRRSDLVAAMSRRLLIDMIIHTKTFENKGSDAAWHNLVEGVIQSGLRDGSVERRVREGAQRPSMVRLAPSA